MQNMTRANNAKQPQMNSSTRQNPLHGVTLVMIVIRLVKKYGWDELEGCVTKPQ